MAGKPGRSGGARPGAGRPPGRRNNRTLAAHAAMALLPWCSDPAQWLLALMSDPRQDVRLRIEAAKALLPFMHLRMV